MIDRSIFHAWVDSAGLYRLDVAVPAMPPGRWRLTINVGIGEATSTMFTMAGTHPGGGFTVAPLLVLVGTVDAVLTTEGSESPTAEVRLVPWGPVEPW